MLIRLALRSLTTRPLRSAVLAAGFGLGIGVMVELLGVGQVILEQATSPALTGGGDVVITGATGGVESARFVLGSLLGSPRFGSKVRAASPARRATLYLVSGNQTMPVAVRGGIPSRERAVGDPETDTGAWRDTDADRAWIDPAPGAILRAMDRFHPLPTADAGASRAATSADRGWAEWLYFNGRSRDGALRFYLSFIAGDVTADGARPMYVRLQLDRGGRIASYTAAARVDDRELTEHAPDVDVAGNRVRLVGSQYRITLSLHAGAGSAAPADPRRTPDVTGDLVLDAIPGRSVPPVEIHGAHGWVSGYVVPVLAGTFAGALTVGGERVALERVAGYHDHNWGFWKGVRWQWGQVAYDAGRSDPAARGVCATGCSIVYGRVFPPSDVADASRIPGFLGLLGPDGPIAFSTRVSIAERGDGDVPAALDVRADGDQLSLHLAFDVAEHERTVDFLQLGGTYHVTGRARDGDIDFTARGSAETFRPAR